MINNFIDWAVRVWSRVVQGLFRMYLHMKNKNKRWGEDEVPMDEVKLDRYGQEK